MAYIYRERKYYCGNYLEVNIFPVFPVAKTRGKKRKPSSKTQQALNRHNAENKLVRLLNTNFTSNDIEIHLTYRNENLPQTEQEAARDIQNFMRRVRRARKKEGLSPLKYVCITEGEPNGKRYHFHITMNGGLDRDELEKLWGFGYANSRRLQFNEHGIEGLARYVTKQFREQEIDGKIVFRKRWTASRNLIMPIPRDRDDRISSKRVRDLARSDINNCIPFEQLYPGFRFASCKPFQNEVNGGYYLTIRMYKDSKVLDNRKRKKRGEKNNEL